MNAIMIPRIQVPELPTLRMPTQELLNRAERYLGYTFNIPHVNEINMLRQLAEVNVIPFEPAAVEAYKRKMLKTTREKEGGGLFNTRLFSSIQWRVCRLIVFKEAIPASVLETAIAIRQRNAHMDVRIEYLGKIDLEEESEKAAKMARATYDPFLVVRAAGTSWHRVAVWDEPTFQG